MKAAAASARSLAAYAVARVLREGVTLDAALKDALAAANPKLGPSVRSLSYGAVRGYYRHEALLGRLLSTPVRSLDFLVRALLSVALYELEDERTPQYAVVDAAVQTAKATDALRAAGLINAVLRRYLRERKTLDADIARNPTTRHASPIWLADRLRADWPVRWTQLLAAGDAQAPMWLRVDSRRWSTEEYIARLQAAGIGARAESRVPWAVALDAPCDVHDLPGFAEGWVSVQDLGAQCVAFPLALEAGSTGCSMPVRRRAGRPLSSSKDNPIWPSWWRSTWTRSVWRRGARELGSGRLQRRPHRRRRHGTGPVVGWRSLRSHIARRSPAPPSESSAAIPIFAYASPRPISTNCPLCRGGC